MSYWDLVNRVVHQADILILVLDARLPTETRNSEIEKKVAGLKKPLIFVINKSDLVDRPTLEALKKKIKNSVFISAKKHEGLIYLRERIGIAAQRANIKGTAKIGVLGYPNVGKSSLINSLRGRESAPVSSMSGQTKRIQNIRTSTTLMFLDTPGVIPYNEKNSIKHAMIGTIDHTKEKNPDLVVARLIQEFPGIVGKYYGVVEDDEVIEHIARKRNLVAKGNVPDINRAARMILKDWQTGKITKK
ncbi:MAG: GTPase [Candidatus Woesearchaeota archaeon]